MENGSTVTGGNITGNGGAVYVDSGTFTMNGGSVAGGHAQYGGGVYIDTDGTFTMNGNAVIEGNKATQNNKGGGGVYVNNGTFTMTGGTIGGDNKNTAMNGGGVYVDANGSFTMDGNAVISNNEVERNGGGVCVFGTFTMKGSAAIRGNNANTTKRWNGGGGVLVCEGGQFEMTGDAVIENNHTDGTGKDDADNNGVNGCGGGVLVRDPGSAFTMSGKARITGNTAVYHGGGVYVDDIFTVSGTPTITDNTVNSTPNNVYLPSGKTITIGTDGLTGGSIGVTAEATAPGNAVQITDTDVTGAVRILISDDATYSVAEDIAISGGSGTAVFLSDAEVAYKSSSELGKTLGEFAEAYGRQTQWSFGGVITLLKDISLTQTAEITGGSHLSLDKDTGEGGTPVTIDLNGHTLSGNGSASVLFVSMGMLEIKDSSANPDGTGGTGKITGGGGSSGGGINVDTSGVLRLVSGSITENEADTGAGVYVSGTFVMTGGQITSNTAGVPGITGRGGGVFIAGSGTATILGTARVERNRVEETSGGVGGGGVYVDGKLNVEGSPKITGNKNNNSGGTNTTNVYLPSSTLVINISGELTDGCSIGVYTPWQDGAERVITSGGGSKYIDKDYFFPDISGDKIELSSDGNELILR